MTTAITRRAPGSPRPAAGRPAGPGQILRGLLALASLGGFVVAGPLVLWLWLGHPVPVIGQAGGALDVVAVVVLLVWSWLVVCVGYEIVAQSAEARGRPRTIIGSAASVTSFASTPRASTPRASTSRGSAPNGAR
ncbi:hypothetical protein I6A84_39470, partial [Frankia sp. CNm7]